MLCIDEVLVHRVVPSIVWILHEIWLVRGPARNRVIVVSRRQRQRLVQVNTYSGIRPDLTHKNFSVAPGTIGAK